ncbi:MAG: hypothetical protein JW913_11970 [Chitinispirillaceae bacterium]|nr:hypothetical protein [Chitinispirillaceae bacterium]
MNKNILQFPLKTGKNMLYQLRVELNDIQPAIYRTLLVCGDAGLDLLHALLQVAIGWTKSHLHQFQIGQVRFSDP